MKKRASSGPLFFTFILINQFFQYAVVTQRAISGPLCRFSPRLPPPIFSPAPYRFFDWLPMCYLKEAPPLIRVGNGPMNCHVKRVAPSCHVITFAILLLAVANLASPTAPDLSVTPATPSFKYPAGSALPAARSLQIASTPTVHHHFTPQPH